MNRVHTTVTTGDADLGTLLLGPQERCIRHVLHCTSMATLMWHTRTIGSTLARRTRLQETSKKTRSARSHPEVQKKYVQKSDLPTMQKFQ